MADNGEPKTTPTPLSPENVEAKEVKLHHSLFVKTAGFSKDLEAVLAGATIAGRWYAVDGVCKLTVDTKSSRHTYTCGWCEKTYALSENWNYAFIHQHGRNSKTHAKKTAPVQV